MYVKRGGGYCLMIGYQKICRYVILYAILTTA